MGFNIAIVGASGAVGQELVRLLSLREFPVNKLSLFTSPRSAGKQISTPFGVIDTQVFEPEKLEGYDFAFFATSGGHAKQFAPEVAKLGVVVIDNSSAFRLDEKVPLIVPEVNPQEVSKHQGIIANPNCSTIQMVVALNPLHKVSPITRINVSTYQAVSGAGTEAIEELKNQLEDQLAGKEISCNKFTKPIAFNLIPHIDLFQDNGYTKEEMKMVYETHKIMGDDSIKISATCVRVPVIRAHSEAISIETKEPISVEKAHEIFKQSKGIQLIDERQDGGYPTPLEASEMMDTFVGRVRKDISCDNGLALWCVADQLWKGAALNAIQIAELLINED